jgi:hypothetical protein
MLLAAHFQGHARALHAQTVEAIALGARNAIYTELLRENLTSNRKIFLVHVREEDAGRRFDVPAESLERIAA